MKKKTLSIITAVAVLSMMLSGCGSSASGTGSTQAAKTYHHRQMQVRMLHHRQMQVQILQHRPMFRLQPEQQAQPQMYPVRHLKSVSFSMSMMRLSIRSHQVFRQSLMRRVQNLDVHSTIMITQ